MKHRFKILLIVAFSITGVAVAEISSNDYAKCAAIKGDLKRLDCFDGLAKEKNLDKPISIPSKTVGKGKWNVSIDVNPVDDSKSVTLVLDATSGHSSSGKEIFMVVRCKSNKTELYINWNDYLGNESNVLTRVGNKKARTKEWGLSTDSKATFHPVGAIGFIKKMMGSDKLLAQVTPYNENPVTAVFDTKGLSNAIKPLRETCRW